MKLYLTIVLSFIFSQISAQSPGEIRGHVIDEKGEPIKGAVIMVKKGWMTKDSATSDIDGAYSIKHIDHGRYDVRVTYLRYEGKIITNVIVDPNIVSEVNVKIEGVEKELDGVFVTPYIAPLPKYKPPSYGPWSSQQNNKTPFY